MFIFIGLIVGVCWVVLLDGSLVLGAVMGVFAGWVYHLSARLRRLQTQHQQLSEQVGHLQAQLVHDIEVKVDETVAAQNLNVAQAETVASSLAEREDHHNNEMVIPAASMPVEPLSSTEPVKPDFMARGFNAAKDWLLGGNPFVRAGIVLLFIGFVFLLRYSLENNLISVELRLLGSASMALLLLITGWRLRERAGAYGLILQAGGIGLLYLTVFGAFSLYQLIPALPAFALLVIIVSAGVMLAVLQNSLALAMFATAGGFLAPILISTGSNNYIGLFTFYAILNVGIFAVAWFKAWRLLNLLGFVFTFAIAAMWGWSSYQPANFPTLQPFLIFFFLLYVLIAILFALRTPVNFKDKVDSTLVFGTPILGFGLQIALVNQFEYGIAISALVLGGFYLLLAGVMWKRYGKSQRLLCETFVVLGVIFTTLSIPFAVEGAMTSAAWAIEGAGVLWISIRQQQWIRRIFAVLLQFGALVFLLISTVEQFFSSAFEAFFNGQFIAMVLIAGAMLFSSRLLSADFPSKRRFEAFLPTLLFISALLFLSAFFGWQLIRSDLYGHFIVLHLAYAIVVALGLLVCQRFSYWPQLRFAFPLLYVLMAYAGLLFIERQISLVSDTQWLAWPVVFLCTYAVLYRYQLRDWFPNWLKVMQVGVLWMMILLLTHEVHLQMQEHFSALNTWYIASLPLLGLVVLWLIMKGRVWPMRDYSDPLLRYVGLPLAGLMGVWVVYSLQSSGESLPLFWLPLLNPLDVVTLLVGLTLLQLYRSMTVLHQTSLTMSNQQRSLFRIICGVLAFTCFNMLILRVMHHWVGLPWQFPHLLINPMTQTVLAIVWTLSGMLFTWQGSKLLNRNLWIGGAVLLVMVVLKLFMVDFASSGTLERIVSFISVGILLLFVGYLAPIPPAKRAVDNQRDDLEVDDTNAVDTLKTVEENVHV